MAPNEADEEEGGGENGEQGGDQEGTGSDQNLAGEGTAQVVVEAVPTRTREVPPPQGGGRGTSGKFVKGHIPANKKTSPSPAQVVPSPTPVQPPSPAQVVPSPTPVQAPGDNGGEYATLQLMDDSMPSNLRTRLQRACMMFGVDGKLTNSIISLWDMTPGYHSYEGLFGFLSKLKGVGGYEVANQIRNVVFGGPTPAPTQGQGYVPPTPPGIGYSPGFVNPEDPMVQLQRAQAQMELAQQRALMRRFYQAEIAKLEAEANPQAAEAPSPDQLAQNIGSLMVESFKTGIEVMTTVANQKGGATDPMIAQIFGLYQGTIDKLLTRGDGGKTEQLIQELANTRAEFLQKQSELQASMFRERLEESRNLGAKQIEMQQDLYKQQLDMAKAISDPRVAIDAKKIDAQVEILKLREQKERETRDREAEHRHQREIIETQTADRLVGLVDRGIQTIADPIAKAFGDSMRSRAGMAPVHIAPPGAGQPAPAGALPLTSAQIQEQIAKIEAHEREVSEVKRRLAQQLQQAQGSGT